MPNTLAQECGRLEATNRELLEALKKVTGIASTIEELHHAGIRISNTDWSDLYDAKTKAKALIAKAEKGG